MSVSRDLPELIVADAAGWRAWLTENHARPTGVFLVLARKGVIEPTKLTYDEALDEALCHGWIDGQLQKRDDMTYRRRFTPRRPGSAWSRRNVELVERLSREGRMHPVGLEEVERAKADGRWQTAYRGQAKIEVPHDLAQALANEPEASAMFENLSAQNRYAILYRVETAKKQETRAKRIEQFVEMLARGETIYPQKNSA
ncbi:MAG TPA: YdeI/OmpD-associated family protein [Gaiellaceae bacterium]|jgi:uncharacterized protein YdeI (YjbR/CyaY-like superfamily)|nr:YdeI/OmpD-associated family protein [Gaiellaceae bacterium]